MSVIDIIILSTIILVGILGIVDFLKVVVKD